MCSYFEKKINLLNCWITPSADLEDKAFGGLDPNN